MKEKLLQAEQQWAKFENDLAMKAIEVEKLRVELNKAWVRLDEVDSSIVEVERCIDSL